MSRSCSPSRAQICVRAGRAARCSAIRSELRLGEARGVPDRLRELLLAHGLEQVADGLGLEGLDRVLVVGGREDHRGRILEHVEVARDLDAVHARHADVEQHDVGIELAHRPRAPPRRCPPRRRPRPRELLEQPAQPLARRRLVVDDEAHR